MGDIDWRRVDMALEQALFPGQELYSQTWDGMGLVLEAMQARMLWLHVRRYQDGYLVAFIDPDQRRDWRWLDTAVELPGCPFDLTQAVALAALRALEMEVPRG